MNKLKNLIINNKKILAIVIISVVFVILIYLIFYFHQLALVSKQRVEQLEERVEFFEALPVPEIPADEIFTPGIVGEVEEGQETPLLIDELPAVIFHSTGLIQEILDNRIIVMGDGSTFTDRQPRQLTLLFTLETSVVLADGRHFVGLIGLQYLQPNMHIFFDSLENIRGKTEFRSHGIKELRF